MRVGSGIRGSGRRNAGSLRTVGAAFARLAQLFLQEGITTPEAESLLRAACVHQAAERVTRLGERKLNISRIAFATGLGRKEVARILKAPDPSLRPLDHPANRVLEAWHTDGIFVVGNRPRSLPVKGGKSKRPSFWALATRYAPDVYPGLLLRELRRTGAVAELKDGRVQARMRCYRPKNPMRRM